MRISCVFIAKCGNRPSCQAHVSHSQPGSCVLRPPSWIPAFPLSVIEMMSALLWLPWQREPQNSNAPGHGRASGRSAESSSGQSCSVALIGAGSFCREPDPEEQAPSVPAFSSKTGWKHWSSVVFLTQLAWRSLLCLCESVTAFTCTKKCDCNVFMKIMKGT